MEPGDNWSALPSDLLGDISLRLIKIEDFTAFRGVCTWWRAVAARNIFKGLSVDKAPLLMLADDKNDEFIFRSLFKRAFFQPAVPEAKGKRLMDARFEWIIAVAPRGGDVYLFNPFTSSRIIKLPQYKCDPEVSFVRKAILSANPSETSKFMVFVLMNNVLEFWMNGDENWTMIGMEPGVPNTCVFTNIGYGDGKMYATDDDFRLWSWDPSATHLTHMQLVQTLFVGQPFHGAASCKLYVLELIDGRLNVIAYYNNRLYIGAIGSGGSGEWRRSTYIGKDAILVDQNGAVAIAADDVPGDFKPNTLYLIDDNDEDDDDLEDDQKCGYQLLVTDVANQTTLKAHITSSSPVCPPFWMFP